MFFPGSRPVSDACVPHNSTRKNTNLLNPSQKKNQLNQLNHRFRQVGANCIRPLHPFILKFGRWNPQSNNHLPCLP